MKSRIGATLTRQDDASILAAGSPTTNDTYTIRGSSCVRPLRPIPAGGTNAPKPPTTGPGWGKSSDFRLTELRASVQRPGTDAAPLKFRSAVASHSRNLAEKAGENDGPLAVFDGDPATCWGHLAPYEAAALAGFDSERTG